MAIPHVVKLRTPGVLAEDLNVPLHRVLYILQTRKHIRPTARAGRLRLFDLEAVALMPRGSGKTTIAEVGTEYAVLFGFHPFTMLIGATGPDGDRMLNTIKIDFMTNELLLEDFPEVLYPIHALEGETRRAGGQRHHGESTYLKWMANRIVMPTIPGSDASGTVLHVAGITGTIRGQKEGRPDGSVVRPSLVIVDDPQTDESARSEKQVGDRLRTMNGAIRGLAGPDRSVSIIVPCTIIEPDDLADQLLDRKRNPEWHGETCKLVYAFPSNEKLWGAYADIRSEELQGDGDGSVATAFYRKNRRAMDKDSRVGWDARFDPSNSISALQFAMNLKIDDEETFWAEYQNEPMSAAEDRDDILTAEQITQKINRLPRGRVPLGCEYLTMHIDVQGKVLYYVITAWESNFSGSIIDYGTYPDQKLNYFNLRQLKNTLKRAKPGAGLEAAIFAGLEKLTAATIGQDYTREDGSSIRIERCLIDANWGESTNIVYEFCRRSEFKGIVMPAHGRGITATNKPMHEWARKRGERAGLNWKVPPLVGGKRMVRHVLFDTNYWKSFVHRRLAIATGDPGALMLYGRKPTVHRMLSEHLVAEQPVIVEANGRAVDEWKIVRVGRDNHLLDNLVGCAVAASMQGAALTGTSTSTPYKSKRKKGKRKLSDIQRAKRAQR